MLRRPFLALLLATSVTGLSCGEIPEPEGFTVAVPTSSSVSTEASAESAESATAALSSAPRPSLPSEFVPRAPDGYVPEVLVAADDVVLLVGGDGTAPLPPLNGGSGAVLAVDDLLGGVVVQKPPVGPAAEGAEVAPPVEPAVEPAFGDVLWFPAPGAEPAIVDDTGARLLDVGYSSGSPTAVVLRPTGEVESIRLVDGAVSPLFTLEPDEELLSLSASGGLHAVVVANGQCGDLRFYSVSGDRLGLPGPGEPDCIVPRRAAYGPASLSPDGGAVAYTVVSYRNDGTAAATEVVVQDLEGGIDYFRRKIGEDGDRITALGFDGDRVVYLRRSPGATTVTLLEVTGANLERPLDLPADADIRSVAFTRLSLAAG